MSYPTPLIKAATAARDSDAGGTTPYACTDVTCTNGGRINHAAGVTPNREHRGMAIHISIAAICEFHADRLTCKMRAVASRRGLTGLSREHSGTVQAER